MLFLFDFCRWKQKEVVLFCTEEPSDVSRGRHCFGPDLWQAAWHQTTPDHGPSAPLGTCQCHAQWHAHTHTHTRALWVHKAGDASGSTKKQKKKHVYVTRLRSKRKKKSWNLVRNNTVNWDFTFIYSFHFNKEGQCHILELLILRWSFLARALLGKHKAIRCCWNCQLPLRQHSNRLLEGEAPLKHSSKIFTAGCKIHRGYSFIYSFIFLFCLVDC